MVTNFKPHGDVGAEGSADRPDELAPGMRFDALVVGAGAGGMAAAARLNHFGYRTLLVESRDRVGGRASTTEIDDFTVNTGALVIATGGENKLLFDELGVDMGVRVPQTPLTLRVGQINVPLSRGLLGVAFSGSLRGMGVLADRFSGLRPPSGTSIGDWITAGQPRRRALRLVRNLTSTMFAAEPSDVDAALFFDYFTKKDALDIGVHPDGSIGPWRTLADNFERTGGTLWLNSEVIGFDFDELGQVSGAIVQRGFDRVRVATALAVSNAGPVATVRLCGDENLPAGYADEVHAQSRPSTLVTINFASRIPLPKLRGLTVFASTSRLAYATEVTAMSPSLAPPGWHLYSGASTPHPPSGAFDVDKEVAMLKRELAQNFPQFRQARVLSVAICAGEEWPAQRAIIGHDWASTTPIANLWNVGDGARPHGQADQSGCVGSARHVTDQIRSKYPAAMLGSDGLASPPLIGDAENAAA